MNLGFSGEMLFLALLGLILFGPRKLPEIARTAGRFMAELKRATSEFQEQFDRELEDAEVAQPAKTLSSLVERIQAVNAVRNPAQAVMALADPKEQIKEQLTGPSFLTNLSEYIAKTSSADKPAEPEATEANHTSSMGDNKV